MRYLLYILLGICSCECWLFPNLFADDKGVIDSFIPAITFAVRKGDTFAMKFARVVCLGLLIYVSYSFIKEPKMMAKFSDASFKGVADILEWGQLKLEGNVSDKAPEENLSWKDLNEDLKNDQQEATGDSYTQSDDTYDNDDDKI
jgi:translocation protein SEC62